VEELGAKDEGGIKEEHQLFHPTPSFMASARTEEEE